MKRILICVLVIALFPPSSALAAEQNSDAIYNQAILQDGNLDKVLAKLRAEAEDANKPVAQRARAWLTASELQWRDGKREGAMEAVDRALALSESVAAVVHKARLLDAAGDVEQARKWYGKSLPLLGAGAEARDVELRLALMTATEGDPKALIEFAGGQTQAARNRTAVVLAILGFQKEALALFRIISPTGPERFQEQLRVTEWAIRAGDNKRAQAQAWEAANSTKVVADRRYALALLVEAHRADNSLDALIERLGSEKNLIPEAREVRVDLLREAGRHEEAIKLVQAHAGEKPSVETRQLLLRLYREAGREADMVAEYRKLIAAEPESLDWPRGLAEHYAGAGDTQAAENVWREFIGRQSASPPLIQAGAEAAAQMGFDALAVETLEALIARGGGG